MKKNIVDIKKQDVHFDVIVDDKALFKVKNQHTQRRPHQYVLNLKEILLRRKSSYSNSGKSLVTVQKSLESSRPLSRSSKGKELFRLACIGFFFIFLLNSINVYYRAIDLKADLAHSAYESFSHIIEAKDQVISQNFNDAYVTLQKVFIDLNTAQKELWFIEQSSSSPLTQGIFSDSLNNIILSGKDLTSAVTYFTQAFDQGFFSISQIFRENDQNLVLTDELKKSSEIFLLGLNHLKKAQNHLNDIDDIFLPSELKGRFVTARSSLSRMIEKAQEWNSLLPSFFTFLGDRYPHRVLVLLQNNNEIRPTGGFIGSFLIVDINDGRTTHSFHDVYDFDGQFYENIEAPHEISSLTQNWKMRDSNYSPDFAISAQKAAWFLEREGGPGVDSVIAVDLEFVKKLLTLTGPITVSDIEFTDQNFDLLLSYIVEAKLTGEKTPKIIIDQFVDTLKQKLFSSLDVKNLIPLFSSLIDEKHVQFYSKIPELQSLFQKFGLNSQIMPLGPKDDFFAAIHSSIGGNKSDRFIEQTINHSTFIEKNGEIIDQVTLQRNHTWTFDTEQNLQDLLVKNGFGKASELLMSLLGGSKNVVSTRFYVPKGSELLDFSGASLELRYDRDLDLDYFYGVISTDHGETSSLAFTYRLPFKLFDENDGISEYNFSTFKQAGIAKETLSKEVHISPGLEDLRVLPPLRAIQDNFWQYEGDFSSDKKFALLLKPQAQ